MTNPPTTQTQDMAGGPAAPLPSPLAGAVTILTAATGKRATKIHRRDGQGGWATQGYDRLKMFSGRVEEARDLRDFMAVLVSAARNPGSLVVAEAIRGDADASHMMRRAHPKAKTGEAATLCPHPVGVQWICWEVDKVEDLPDWFDPHNVKMREDDDRLADWWVRAHLPTQFHGRSMILQWSASGLLAGRVSFHLWMWLDRPVSRASVRAYAMAHWRSRMDCSIWDSARVHYIASPIFEGVDGERMEDPLGAWRWQWIPGVDGDACEALPEWVDQPTWEQQLAAAKAETEKMRAEFAASRKEKPAKKGDGGGEVTEDETGGIVSVSLLPLEDLDPKLVFSLWRSG